MMISVKKETPSSLPLESCCFCRRPTKYWTNLPDRSPAQQVACCYTCASQGEPEHVPTKDLWCQREKIASASDESWKWRIKPVEE